MGLLVCLQLVIRVVLGLTKITLSLISLPFPDGPTRWDARSLRTGGVGGGSRISLPQDNEGEGLYCNENPEVDEDKWIWKVCFCLHCFTSKKMFVSVQIYHDTITLKL